MKKKSRILAVFLCLVITSILLTIPVSATETTNTGIDLEASKSMEEYAFNIYKLICMISIPIAIISLASCGWKFLGSIFFGNYASMAGNDMMKAQKQFVYTILGIMFIILLPRIFGAAISFFKNSAWQP